MGRGHFYGPVKGFHFHFIPIPSSWLNLVERWCGEITRKRIRRGVFRSVDQLMQAIKEYIAHNNEHPKPFTWTKYGEDFTCMGSTLHCPEMMDTLERALFEI